MKSSAGLTLLEVIVALVVLVVGVLLAATMQTSALRASSDASAVQGVTKFAEAEIELRRQIDLSTDAGKAALCITSVTGYNCQVAVATCTMPSTTLVCTGGTGTVVADQVKVTVSGPRSKTVTLTTVKAR